MGDTAKYDVNGRRVSDAVTTLPDGVDGSVRRIERGYDSLGRLQRVTSYDSVIWGHNTIFRDGISIVSPD